MFIVKNSFLFLTAKHVPRSGRNFFRGAAMNIKQAIETVSLKDLIESTGRQAATANTAKGEYTYSAPYREDHDPSLKINVHTRKFIDYGQDDAKGDVIQLARLIMGNGNASSVTVSDALQWLKRFSGKEVAPTPAKPIQRPEKPAFVASFEGDRYQFVKSVPISAKSHPNNLTYIVDHRGISLRVAALYLQAITYRDNAAPKDDPLKGYRYGIGGQNDSGGHEVRAASTGSNFKTSLGQKDVSTFIGQRDATTGHIFEGRFDFLTLLEMTAATRPANPTIILNTGRLAARAAQIIKSRQDWQNVKHWHIWQHNDDEGHRMTQAFIEELGEGYTVGTLEHLYEGYNDLNEYWTDAPSSERAALTAQIKGSQPAKKPDEIAITEVKGHLNPYNKLI